LSNGYEYIFCLTQYNTGRKFKRYNFNASDYLKNYIVGNVNTNNNYKNIHNALMPLWLAEYIIKNFTKENDLVFDPFGGLFTTAIACLKNNRKYVCTEKEAVYYNEGKERIKLEKAKIDNKFYLPEDERNLFNV
jgi:DNA modification methylase